MSHGLRLLLPAIFALLLLPAFGRADGPQPSACIECHAALDAQELARPVAEWQTSVHAENGISCSNCHGGDMTIKDEEAMSPARGFSGVPAEEAIPAFCGKCHRGVEEDYQNSAHGQALGAGGPQCVTCHGNHAIIRPSPALINPRTCTRCHSFERAALIREALVETDSRIAALEQGLNKLKRRGITVKELQASVFEARNTFHRLFHTVDVEKVRERTGGIQAQLAKVDEELTQIRNRLLHIRQAGAVVVALLCLLTALLFYLRHTYSLEERQGQGQTKL